MPTWVIQYAVHSLRPSLHLQSPFAVSHSYSQVPGLGCRHHWRPILPSSGGYKLLITFEHSVLSLWAHSLDWCVWWDQNSPCFVFLLLLRLPNESWFTPSGVIFKLSFDYLSSTIVFQKPTPSPFHHFTLTSVVLKEWLVALLSAWQFLQSISCTSSFISLLATLWGQWDDGGGDDPI